MASLVLCHPALLRLFAMLASSSHCKNVLTKILQRRSNRSTKFIKTPTSTATCKYSADPSMPRLVRTLSRRLTRRRQQQCRSPMTTAQLPVACTRTPLSLCHLCRLRSRLMVAYAMVAFNAHKLVGTRTVARAGRSRRSSRVIAPKPSTCVVSVKSNRAIGVASLQHWVTQSCPNTRKVTTRIKLCSRITQTRAASKTSWAR